MNFVVQRVVQSTLAFFLLVAAIAAAIAQTPPAAPSAAPPTAPSQTTPSLATPSQATSRRPLALAGQEGLFQRIIVRPGAVIAERPEAAAPSRPVPGFSVFYVYERKQVGQESWLEVGDALDGRTQGWIAGARTVDWKHNLVLAFNNPAGRERALFFENADVTRRLWLSTTRAADAARYRREALATPPAPSSPVVAVEPETYVDITRQFYFLPVLSAEHVTTEQGQPARLLEVISAPAPSTRRATADAEALRNFKGVVVFVVDTTISMEPYIVQTREAIKRVISRIRDTAVRDNFRFGLIAYRDHMGGDPALEYVTQPVYLPSFADAPDAILPNIAKVEQAKANNRDWDEDAIAGLKLALDKVNWTEFGGRYIVLITDAGTRDAHDPLSETRLGIAELKALGRIEGKQIAIHAIHLRTPAGQSNHARAEQQYRELTDFGTAGALYYPVPGGGEAPFRQAVDNLADHILQQVAATVGHPVAAQRAPQTEAERQMARQAEMVGTAMRLSYLGRTREQTAPDVVRSFVLDEDPADPVPAKKPLDVRVLLTKNQLSDLAKAARAISDAETANRLSPGDFFSQVRAATGATARDPRRLSEALRRPGTFIDALKDLPYNSPIMEITPEEWSTGMPASQRREVVNALRAKLRLYEELNSQPSLWVGFDGRQGTGEAFYPLPIDQLP